MAPNATKRLPAIEDYVWPTNPPEILSKRRCTARKRPYVTKGADRKPLVAREELDWMDTNELTSVLPGSYKQPLAYCYVMNAGIWNVRVYTLSYYYSVAHLSVLPVVYEQMILLVMAKLRTLAHSISDEPWIVGDFNTVLDMRQWPCSHLPLFSTLVPLIILRCDPRRFCFSYSQRKRRSVFECQNSRLNSLVQWQKTVLQTDRHNTLLIRLEKNVARWSSPSLLKRNSHASQRRRFMVKRKVEINARESSSERDKAPGPDATPGFYKALACHRDEVVKQSWNSLLQGVVEASQHHYASLIPKRLRLVLDAMISPSQNAFVPGRSIGVLGLATGDPMSPFLFVLVMEVLQLMMQQLIDQNEGFSYHWRCKELGLFQLCFADDLLLFCKADVASIQVFRRGLDEFANLRPSSQIILGQHRRAEHLIAALQFQEGHLPSGRLQLIKSVLMSLNVYWAKAFILPKGVIREVEKRMRISCGKELDSGYPKRFPCGPSRTNIPAAATLSTVIVDGAWCWPLITDMECMKSYMCYRPFTMVATLFYGEGATSLRRLSMIYSGVRDLSGVCVLCGRAVETHEHLFSGAATLGGVSEFEEHCRFSWPNRAWGEDITWASKRYMGRHIVQAAYRALLAAIVYHIWQERNQRVFRHITRPSSTIARNAIDAIRQKILSLELLDSVSSRGLYRLWRIPWPVRDTA
ncbi:hypothetical protein Sango_3059400 [Sesamum angolense]|uniref:Reverse transcriptase domain-containing protein n=1 Tax=Sesamum angolense TaxID=2727404 RepID=A0AAE1TAI6_9LAMI|nr:hypothetical protein Sango_3059400 [Sesamum angolense]